MHLLLILLNCMTFVLKWGKNTNACNIYTHMIKGTIKQHFSMHDTWDFIHTNGDKQTICSLSQSVYNVCIMSAASAFVSCCVCSYGLYLSTICRPSVAIIYSSATTSLTV